MSRSKVELLLPFLSYTSKNAPNLDSEQSLDQEEFVWEKAVCRANSVPICSQWNARLSLFHIPNARYATQEEEGDKPALLLQVIIHLNVSHSTSLVRLFFLPWAMSGGSSERLCKFFNTASSGEWDGHPLANYEDEAGKAPFLLMKRSRSCSFQLKMNR